MSEQPNRYQKKVLQTYGGGDFAWMIDEFYTDEAFKSAYSECGDTLLVFLMRELGPDCDAEEDGLAEAQRRVEAAIDDLTAVNHALYGLDEGRV